MARPQSFQMRSSDEPLLAQMSADMSKAMALYAQGVGYAEIAERLGIKIGTVKSRLNRARAQLVKLREKAKEAAL